VNEPRSHRIYLFEMRNGRKKVSWGKDPEDALEVLRLRLTQAEMAEIVPDRWVRVSQRDLSRWEKELG
jgi:hypothetical protein